jgi:hypothetical protein
MAIFLNFTYLRLYLLDLISVVILQICSSYSDIIDKAEPIRHVVSVAEYLMVVMTDTDKYSKLTESSQTRQHDGLEA